MWQMQCIQHNAVVRGLSYIIWISITHDQTFSVSTVWLVILHFSQVEGHYQKLKPQDFPSATASRLSMQASDTK